MVFYEIDINYGDKCSELESILIGDRMDSFLSQFNRDNAGNLYVTHNPDSDARTLKHEVFYMVFLSGKADYVSWIINDFISGCGISDLSIVSFNEVTVHYFAKEVSGFNKKAVEFFGLTEYINENSGLTEYLHSYSKMNRRKALGVLSKNLCSSCCEEFYRIFSHRQRKVAFVNPVQYIVKASTQRTSKIIRDTLISSLYATGRINSLRVTDMVPSIYDSVEDNHLMSFKGPQRDFFSEYNLQEGATVAVHKIKTVEMNVDLVAECINTTHRDVLTILDLRKDDDVIIQELMSKCPGVRFVILSDDAVPADRAADFLRVLAKEQGIRNCNNELTGLLDVNTLYSTGDLEEVFEVWLSRKYVDKCFPEYSDLPVVKNTMPDAVGDAYRELEELVGLDKVKELIKSIIAFCSVQKQRSDKGLPAVKGCKHMVFAGNPGTAKTTVARLLARILKENGVISCGNLYEAGRADLVGKYVGHTAPKVKAAFNMARGSVLFIDEAYSLLDDNSFGDEAINTLVQEMEDHKDDVIVILAGYSDRMKQFINSNPGLRSRIAFNVQFDDYSTDELSAILERFAGNSGYEFGPGSKEKARDVIEKAKGEKNFGNGRYVRNLFERAVMNQCSRIFRERDNSDAASESSLSAQDFTYQEEEVINRHFGF